MALHGRILPSPKAPGEDQQRAGGSRARLLRLGKDSVRWWWGREGEGGMSCLRQGAGKALGMVARMGFSSQLGVREL